MCNHSYLVTLGKLWASAHGESSWCQEAMGFWCSSFFLYITHALVPGVGLGGLKGMLKPCTCSSCILAQACPMMHVDESQCHVEVYISSKGRCQTAHYFLHFSPSAVWAYDL